MAELATIARPYAEALFKASAAADALAGVGSRRGGWQGGRDASCASSPTTRRSRANLVFNVVADVWVARAVLGDARRTCCAR
jgi:hypothetical protein